LVDLRSSWVSAQAKVAERQLALVRAEIHSTWQQGPRLWWLERVRQLGVGLVPEQLEQVLGALLLGALLLEARAYPLFFPDSSTLPQES
jgi:hypothetical protein